MCSSFEALGLIDCIMSLTGMFHNNESFETPRLGPAMDVLRDQYKYL